MCSRKETILVKKDTEIRLGELSRLLLGEIT